MRTRARYRFTVAAFMALGFSAGLLAGHGRWGSPARRGASVEVRGDSSGAPEQGGAPTEAPADCGTPTEAAPEPPRRVTFRGEVRFLGQAVVGARVSLSGGVPEVSTDAHGQFVMPDLPAGRYALRAVGAGAAAYRDAIVVAGPPAGVGPEASTTTATPVPPLTIELLAAPDLSGRVVDSGGHAAAGVEITLAEGAFAPLPRKALSDAGGVFRVPSVLEGRYLISTSAVGFVPLVVPLRAPSAALTIKLERAAVVVGEVLDESGRAVPGALVTVARDDGYAASAWAGRSSTGKGPLVEPAGELGVVRGPIPYPPLDTSPPAATAEATSPPHSPSRSPSRAPSPAAKVAPDALVDRPPAVTTDAQGHFRVVDVAAGRAVLVVSHPAFSDGRSGVLTLAAGNETHVKVSLRRGLSVRGSVNNGRGGMLVGAELWVGGALSTMTDKRGRFELRRLAGPVDVEVRMRGYAPGHRHIDPSDPRDAGEVELSVGAIEERLTGVVLDERGRAIAEARVSVVCGDGVSQSMSADRNGEFVITGAMTRPIKLVVTHGEHLSATVADVMPGDDVRVILSAGGVVEGELRADRGLSPAGARVVIDDSAGAHRVGFVDGAGRFRVAGCAPGTASLHAVAPGFLPIKADLDLPVADRSGEVVLRDLRLVMSEAGSVLGVVTDRYGTPLANVGVEGGGASAKSDRAGRFSLRPVPIGRLEVTATGETGRGSAAVDVLRGRGSSVEIRVE